MRVQRKGISTTLGAAIVIVGVLAAGGAYLFYAEVGTKPGGMSSTTSPGATTSNSGSSTTSTSTSNPAAAQVVMSMLAKGILTSSDVVVNYTMRVVVIGTLDGPLTLSEENLNGINLTFQPGTVQPGDQATDVTVTFKVANATVSGASSFNVIA